MLENWHKKCKSKSIQEPNMEIPCLLVRIHWITISEYIGDMPFRKGFRFMDISSYAGMPAKPLRLAGVPELVRISGKKIPATDVFTMKFFKQLRKG